MRSMGPPFHVEVLLILTLTPWFSAVAAQRIVRRGTEGTGDGVLAGFLYSLSSVSQEDATSPWRLP